MTPTQEIGRAGGLEMSPPAVLPTRPRRRRLRRPQLEQATRGMGPSIALSLAPAIVLFTLFFLIPFGVVLVTSMSDWGPIGLSFTWFDNFSTLFSDPAFSAALKNTAFFCAVAVFVQVPIGVALGVILAERIRGWKFLRTIYFLPNIISIAALAMVYLSVYNPRYGLLNQLLGALGFSSNQDWLFNLNTALPAVAATWALTAGVVMILTMAEIAAIPDEIYDAAQVDGASRWGQIRHVTLPLLRNIIGVSTILVLLLTIGYFDGVYIMTSGGPANHTLTLALYAFQEYSSGHWGYANAIGAVLIAISVLAILIVRRIFRVGERDF